MRATAAQSQESGRALVGGAGSRLDRYLRSGEPYIWATAAAISLAFLITAGLLLLLVSRGLPHFWPAELVQAVYAVPGQAPQPLLVEIRDHEAVTTRRLQDAGLPVAATQPSYERLLVKTGNRELGGVDFRYLLADWLQQRSLPADASVFERLEWGNFHGYVLALKRDGQVVASGEQAWVEYQALQPRIDALRAQRRALEKGAIASVNGQLERLRLAMRHLELEGRTAQDSPGAFAPLMQRREQQQAQYQSLRHARRCWSGPFQGSSGNCRWRRCCGATVPTA
jgi:phosphate transport system permease protein